MGNNKNVFLFFWYRLQKLPYDLYTVTTVTIFHSDLTTALLYY